MKTKSKKIINIKEENKKNKIIKAAIEIFSKKGFHRATIRDIAAKADVSIGLIYFYFKNKEDILKEIFKQIQHMPIETVISSYGNIDFEKAFQIITNRSFNLIARDFKLIVLFLNESARSFKLSEFFYQEFLKSIDDVASFFKKYFKNLKKLDSQIISFLFISLIFGISIFKEGAFKRQFKDKSYNDYTNYIVKIFLNGFKNLE